jgi:hypothetical protein
MSPRAPRESQERAFLESVLYASLFDYPLTPSQLRIALIRHDADEHELVRWYQASDLLQETIEFTHGYFFPRGRGDVLQTRLQREEISRGLLRKFDGPLRLIARMPFVRMVALSGSLAHLNADDDADLDLFVITTGGRVWSVTVTFLLLARLFGWRRQVCLNYVISERELRVSPADLFVANQIVHLRPIAGTAVFARFLQANPFVERFYPNFSQGDNASIHSGPSRNGRHTLAEALLTIAGAPLYERLCRLLYGLHLRRRSHTWASREQVRLEAECLKLHTSSHRADVLDRFDGAVTETLERVAAIRSSESAPARVAR